MSNGISFSVLPTLPPERPRKPSPVAPSPPFLLAKTFFRFFHPANEPQGTDTDLSMFHPVSRPYSRFVI